MKIHFGLFEDWGDYEHPLTVCERTLCGCEGEIPTENSVEEWKLVTCKKCLRLKERYEMGVKADEEAIVHQMGEMAEFFKKEELANNCI